MRIFISSVRRGLEEERDALAGLIQVLGHDPVRFEDFTAKPVPSREACMRGIDSSDAYLLLMGEKYGEPLPETGQSPTHDEVIRAKHKGIDRFVFVKSGVDMEPLQRALLDQLEAYGTGVFRGSFSSTADLITKVTAVVRDLENNPSKLDFAPLTDDVEYSWRGDWHGASGFRQHSDSMVELHVRPVPPAPVSARVLREASDRLVAALRSSGAVAAHEGLEPITADNSVSVEVPARREDHMLPGHIRPGGVRGLRLERTGQASVWWAPPGDGMGVVLSTTELPEAFANALRLIGDVAPKSNRYALAAAVSGSFVNVVDGPPPASPRSQASFGHSNGVHIQPDESVSAAALGVGAAEAGRDLAAALIDKFRRTG